MSKVLCFNIGHARKLSGLGTARTLRTCGPCTSRHDLLRRRELQLVKTSNRPLHCCLLYTLHCSTHDGNGCKFVTTASVCKANIYILKFQPSRYRSSPPPKIGNSFSASEICHRYRRMLHVANDRYASRSVRRETAAPKILAQHNFVYVR